MERRFRDVAFPAILIGIAAWAAGSAWVRQGADRPVWDIHMGLNQQDRSTITIQNQCQQTHRFSVTPQQLPFLRLGAAPTTDVPARSTFDFPVRLDATGLKAGVYQGTVVVKCENCKNERTCQQDIERLPVRLTVDAAGAGAGAGPGAGPVPPPQDKPGAGPVIRGRSSSTSSTPCGPPPAATTYSVKDLKSLPTLDGSVPHCMATGVNAAGNVAGACLGKYKGGPVSGSWRAFLTAAGGAVIAAADDLGFPTGATGGVSFAMAVNDAGHVVGYWADAPTGGVDHKAFWQAGAKKMISLHPAAFPLKVSEAYALNASDTVVGAAWTLFSDKHAMIWPSAGHPMVDLNDLMDAASKKTWTLIEAYAINDAGEIVGRAKHESKLHAFLLKATGAAPVDLGALAEFKDDSSAAYSLNACDDVAGYTYTPAAAHHGFRWTPSAGMTDMGAIVSPYGLSYAQALNIAGESVGVVSKTFHHSAFFEGIGFAVGSDPSGVAYSHAVWYNGKDLKDLNALIPGATGWELSLANSINDKGLIAGAGFHKDAGYKSGSLLTKAVLLMPADLSPLAAPPAKLAGETAPPCALAIAAGYLFDNWNICGVTSGPHAATVFTLSAPSLITFIATYHWNSGMGALPKKGLSVKSAAGAVFGPWAVTTSAGSGGAPNVNWECHPGVVLPAGTYTILDPDPATWSQNGASGTSGFARVAGSPKK